MGFTLIQKLLLIPDGSTEANFGEGYLSDRWVHLIQILPPLTKGGGCLIATATYGFNKNGCISSTVMRVMG